MLENSLIEDVISDGNNREPLANHVKVVAFLFSGVSIEKHEPAIRVSSTNTIFDIFIVYDEKTINIYNYIVLM